MNEIAPSSSPANLIWASGHIAYQWDLNADRIIWCGPWQQLFGPDRAMPPGNALELSNIVLPSDHHMIFSDTPPAFERDYRLRKGDGALLWVHEQGTTDFENGRAVRQQGMIRIIDDIEKRSPHATFCPDRDPLTGRPNRSCMLALIDKLLKTSRENRRQSAYLAVGIDKLAFVNEAMGTRAADQIICAVADRLNELCPTRALVGRAGGDMFGILLPGMAREMGPLIDRLLASFHDHAINAGATCLHLSICVGAMPFEDTQGDAADLVIHAELALSEAREKGRGQYVIYSESERRATQNRAILDMYERVKQALKNKALRLAFQPVLDARSGSVAFYEVLSRLFYDDGSPIPAGEFIPVVEQMGMAPEFDEYVLDLAIAEMAQSATLRLAVNISGLTAALPHWPEKVQKRLSQYPDIANRMIIEVTETAAVMDIAKMRCLVESVRKAGSEVALDDFGAGSTSIRHLRELDFAIMKIDRDLLINLTTNEEQQHLVRMLIGMAHGLGLRSVAEGIEDAETAQWLRREGVDMLQGFFFGRPSFDKPWLCDGIKAPPAVPLFLQPPETAGVQIV